MIDKTITYRLIGAGIMVLSAAVILPLILDGERPPELDMQVSVTSAPDFKPPTISPAKPIDEFHQSVVDSEVTEQVSSNDIRLLPTPKPARSLDNTGQSAPTKPSTTVSQDADKWTLQIATFKSNENAVRLVNRLKEAGYSAYSITSNSLHKVYVGPEFKREASLVMREEIKSKFNLTGIVVKYSLN